MFRIIKIKGCKTCKEVLLARVCDPESGNDYIEICSWHNTADDLLYQHSTIECNENLIDLIINDFSESSANNFANSMAF